RLCPAWRKWGTARMVKPDTVILHSRADDAVPFADSEELVRNSGLPAWTLIEVGSDHRLADPEPLAAMLKACEAADTRRGEPGNYSRADTMTTASNDVAKALGSSPERAAPLPPDRLPRSPERSPGRGCETTFPESRPARLA